MQASYRLVLPAFVLFCAAPLLAREVGTFDRSLNVNGSVDLTVETNSGHVTVRAGGSNTVQIHGIVSVSDSGNGGDAERRAREVQANPPIHQTGNTIHVDRLPSFGDDRHISIAYELTVPAATRLRSSTGSGGQTVEGIRGPVAVTTGSGGVRISRIDTEVRAQTGSGGIELDRIKGRVDAQAGSGGLHGGELAGPVVAHTGSGGITLRLPANSGFDLRASTGSGRIYTAEPITVQGSFSGRHEMNGKIRGGGALLDLSTGSGGIHIE